MSQPESYAASSTRPIYRKIPSGNLFAITCDEGWRTSIVCSQMYEWAADWLVKELQGKPYASGRRP